MLLKAVSTLPLALSSVACMSVKPRPSPTSLASASCPLDANAWLPIPPAEVATSVVGVAAVAAGFPAGLNSAPPPTKMSPAAATSKVPMPPPTLVDTTVPPLPKAVSSVPFGLYCARADCVSITPCLLGLPLLALPPTRMFPSSSTNTDVGRAPSVACGKVAVTVPPVN